MRNLFRFTPRNPFRDLTKLERSLWLFSVLAITASFAASHGGDILTLIASLIGVTALIFLAKGYVLGQVLTIVFAVFYGVISYYFRYYGEMLTYLGMTAPSAAAAAIAWLRHPYQGTKEVEVHRLSARQRLLICILCAATTFIFYHLLALLGNANLPLSTISVTTSFLASALTFFRSPYYALAYAANDVILIGLWVLASMEDVSYLPMVVCFAMFLLNDLYGFFSWQRMKKRQAE